MQRICVFAGSSVGVRPAYAVAARSLGQVLAGRGIGIVYGGASIGLMGVVADAALAAGGEVIGVMPRGLFRREVAHPALTALHEVDSMHERKALMASLADGFIALPGGFGTFDELFETITWAQIGIHAKPIGLLDVAGYFAPLFALVEHAIAEGFIPADNRHLVLQYADPERLVSALVDAPSRAAARPPSVEKPEP